jgi:hypothetical protein
MNNKLAVRLAGIGAAAGSAAANAASTIDTSGVTGAMTDAGLAIAVVGAAYLVVKVGIKVWPWVASAMGR